MAPTLADVEAARARLAGVARETPLYPSETFSRLSGRTVLLKAENLQRTGSFKIRGAYNTISTLGDSERAAGVVAASAGNHGQAVAWAAREAGSSATIFMPEDAPMAKVEATRSYGGEVELAGKSFEDAVAAAQEHVERTGATLVHAFEDSARHRRPGDDRARARGAGAGSGDGAHPRRRRRPRRRDLDRAPRAAPGSADRRRRLPAGAHDRGRDLGEVARRAGVVHPRADPGRHRGGLGRGDLGRARALPGAEEAPRRRVRARSGSPRFSRAAPAARGRSRSSSRAGTSTRRRSSP